MGMVMLVLTTMFVSVSNNLPNTAYIKMIDIWLLFNLFKPFVYMNVQTYRKPYVEKVSSVISTTTVRPSLSGMSLRISSALSQLSDQKITLREDQKMREFKRKA